MATMVHYNLQPLLSTLFFLLPLLGPLCCGATEYYVKPTEYTQCPGEPCHTLIEYAKDGSHYFTSVFNVTFLFLPGVHPLNQSLVATNATDVSFQSDGSNVTIFVNGETAGFVFSNISNLTITHLNINNTYGGEVPPLQFDYITNLRIVGVTIESGGSSISATNTLGYSEITNLTMFYTPLALLSLNKNKLLSFWYTDNPDFHTPTSNHLVIQDSRFLGFAVFATWIYVVTLQTNYTVEIDILRDSIKGLEYYSLPSNPYSATVLLVLLSTSTVIRIMNSSLINENNNTVAAIEIILSDTSPSNNASIDGQIHISGCEIKGYRNTALVIYKNQSYIILGSPIDMYSFKITVVDTIFTNNLKSGCFISSGDTICASTVVIFAHTPVIFINTTFENNTSINPSGMTSTVYLWDANNVSFVNCSFHGNIGTPITAINSTFHVFGNMSFVNNTGKKGGAMAFYVGSEVTFDNHTHILFQNNSAVVGGAIFVDEGYDLFIYRYQCFFYLTSTVQVSLCFVNNTAQNGGNAIYGASLDTCLSLHPLFPVEVINEISRFEPSEDLSKITSPPSRVCLCDKDGKPDCASSVQSIYPPPMYHYPGETFTISAVLVGVEFGTVSGSVYAQFLLLNKSRTSPQFGTLQKAQRVGHNSCADLEYSVLSNNRSEILVLTVGETSVNSFLDESILERIIANYEEVGYINSSSSLSLLTVPVYLNITLLLCPLGFTLASPPGECVCDRRVQENNITCNITDQTLHRSGTIWINASSANDGVIIAEFCPFDYCKSEQVAVNLLNPDSQCNFNHSGTLCGGCQPGLSLALGSSQCHSCSNTYLVLIVSFAIAGIALVFFIKVLNLTVSKGTINGLILYANIVGAIPSTFFPAGATNFLTVFIAWLNLDLGIETCFFDGLDAYWKTWLQFVFPAYIWAIIGLIIFLSQLSQLATKILGNNLADVLATLLLLSYAKLFHTIISALSFSFLEMPDGTRVAVWSIDGNIPYLSGKHIPLFLIALAVLLLLWLPFTAVLLFWQLLQRLTHYKIVRWIVINKRPFFETYFGPLKGEHRYWVGVLLLVRGVLLIIFVVVPADETGVHLLSIITVTVILLTYAANLPHTQQQGDGRRVTAAVQDRSLHQKIQDYLGTFSGWCYNSWYLSLLENSFIFNLIILSAATFYVYSSGGNQAAVAYTSVGIAFAQFVGIVCYHMLFSLRNWWRNHKERNDGELLNVNRAEYERINDEPAPIDDEPAHFYVRPPPIRDGPFLRVDFSEYREPVLGHYD